MIASHIVTELVILWLKRHNCNSNFNFVSAFEKKTQTHTHTHSPAREKKGKKLWLFRIALQFLCKTGALLQSN